jgi:inorganic pyrophosphatase
MKPESTWKHPWHDLRIGKKAPEKVIAFIECPKGSIVKYEIDKKSGYVMLDRVLYSSVHYPGDYGFIPQTLSEDGDPLDIICISNFPVYPGVIVKARPIAVVDMIDGGERDEKIIAVMDADPRLDNKQSLDDVHDHIITEIRHFFETYKLLQKKQVEILGIRGKEDAHEEIRKAIERYNKEYSTKE